MALNESKYSVKAKGDRRNLVTDMDIAIEKFLRDKIQEHYPKDSIIGEESYKGTLDEPSKYLWYIDPIDGTSNFVKQGENYCTMIALFREGVPVLSYIYDIVKGILYWAGKSIGAFENLNVIKQPDNQGLGESTSSLDIRRMSKKNYFLDIVDASFNVRSIGSAGLDGAKVITGSFGAYINASGGPWDYAPLALFADILDLHLSDLDGNELCFEKESGFIFSTKAYFEDYQKIVN